MSNDDVVDAFSGEDLLKIFVICKHSKRFGKLIAGWQSGMSEFDKLMASPVDMGPLPLGTALAGAWSNAEIDIAVLAKRYTGKIAKDSQSFWDVIIKCGWLSHTYSDIHISMIFSQRSGLAIAKSLVASMKAGDKLACSYVLNILNAFSNIGVDRYGTCDDGHIPGWLSYLLRGMPFDVGAGTTKGGLHLLLKIGSKEAANLLDEVWSDKKIARVADASLKEEIALIKEDMLFSHPPERGLVDMGSLDGGDFTKFLPIDNAEKRLVLEMNLGDLGLSLKKVLGTDYLTNWVVGVIGEFSENLSSRKELCELIFGNGVRTKVSAAKDIWLKRRTPPWQPEKEIIRFDIEGADYKSDGFGTKEYMDEIRARFGLLISAIGSIGEVEMRSQLLMADQNVTYLGKVGVENDCVDKIFDRWDATIRKEQIVLSGGKKEKTSVKVKM